jgi:hypothetical protein
MVYVFEGARNSGKTFLSKLASERTLIPRFQFDFVGGLNVLNTATSASREAHAFAMGKELMLMQLSSDGIISTDFIHDRGILSVLAWGVIEKRISKEQARSQLDYVFSKGLLAPVSIVYIEGQNPDQGPRNKDQWDFADGKSDERKTYEWLLGEMQKKQFSKVHVFENRFDQESANNFLTFFNQVVRS